MYLLYECRAFSFKYTSSKINTWKETGINNYTKTSNMDAISVATTSLPVCSYHVTYTFQSESTLHSCLNVKELLARSRREI